MYRILKFSTNAHANAKCIHRVYTAVFGYSYGHILVLKFSTRVSGYRISGCMPPAHAMPRARQPSCSRDLYFCDLLNLVLNLVQLEVYYM